MQYNTIHMKDVNSGGGKNMSRKSGGPVVGAVVARAAVVGYMVVHTYVLLSMIQQ